MEIVPCMERLPSSLRAVTEQNDLVNYRYYFRLAEQWSWQ
jgi:hypothetical protein